MSDSPTQDRLEASALDEVGAVIKRESREIAGEARTTAYRVARDQRDAVAAYVSALAQAALRGADDLEGSGYPRSAATVKRTAGEVGGFADRLQRREPDLLWADVEGFARDHPGLTFGTGFVLAFGLTRFLASAPSRGAEAEEGLATGSDGTGGAERGGGAPPAGG